MANLSIELPRAAFQPNDTVRGVAAWDFATAPHAIEARLFWFTRGKGTVDASVVATARFDQPLARDRQPFELRLPATPFSFSGSLVSLIWAVELVTEPTNENVLTEIVMSPTASEILLPRIETAEDRIRTRVEERFRGWQREGAR